MDRGGGKGEAGEEIGKGGLWVAGNVGCSGAERAHGACACSWHAADTRVGE